MSSAMMLKSGTFVSMAQQGEGSAPTRSRDLRADLSWESKHFSHFGGAEL